MRGLRRSFGPVEALAGVDLTVAAGEVAAVVGPNGAGKTTLLSTVAGLLRPHAGEVILAGVDARADGRRARRLCGFAPQRLGLSPTLSVEENLVFFARLGGAGPAAARRGAAEVAEALGLGDLLRRRAGRLSGGEQRRAHVAAALVHRPPVVLLDEPTASVDPSGRQAILDLVRDAARRGSAVCWSTHQLSEVESLGATVALLHRGRLLARGEPGPLAAQHARTVVELLFAAEVEPALVRELAAVEGLTAEAAPADRRVVRVAGQHPGRALAGVLGALGRLGARVPPLESVEVVKPGLGAVFLALTGERYPDPGTDGALVALPAEEAK